MIDLSGVQDVGNDTMQTFEQAPRNLISFFTDHCATFLIYHHHGHVANAIQPLSLSIDHRYQHLSLFVCDQVINNCLAARWTMSVWWSNVAVRINIPPQGLRTRHIPGPAIPILIGLEGLVLASPFRPVSFQYGHFVPLLHKELLYRVEQGSSFELMRRGVLKLHPTLSDSHQALHKGSFRGGLVSVPELMSFQPVILAFAIAEDDVVYLLCVLAQVGLMFRLQASDVRVWDQRVVPHCDETIQCALVNHTAHAALGNLHVRSSGTRQSHSSVFTL
mmetsp:Transcript_65830/g.157319  ORF Transcript_65830/g.157319 Transcript_65830/m.157319 type:complete len:276 (-) Transcript_65830:257-1084(-)